MKKRLRKKIWKKGRTKYGMFMFNLVEKLNSGVFNLSERQLSP
ncbi:hypothetical protein N399_24540 (plasmid) [Bacillus licheniformis CG-B52]|nr:hypothetical protein N399_24540 [Bacillus licheniformis CG-B52]TWM14404.1 hypothetical protein CHCC15087_3973 [Bacillus licheniformis]